MRHIIRGRRFLCLVPAFGPDIIVSVPVHWGDMPAVEFCGMQFKRTSGRTGGGYKVYREATA